MFKIVLWDVYGTLLVPRDRSNGSVQDLHRAFARLAADDIAIPPESGSRMYYELIGKLHRNTRLRDRRIVFPEFDIRDLWEEMFRQFGITGKDPEEVSLAFEEAANPVQAVEQNRELIIYFNEQRLIQGLSSNSQWYTIQELSSQYGELFDSFFQSEYFFMSYLLGFSKPDPLFYETIASALGERGYRAGECLFIGDDPQNDVHEPNRHGFKAVCCRDKRGAIKDTQAMLREIRDIAP